MEKVEVFNQTVRGYRHIQDGTVCEDASISFADPAQRFYIAAIADGHGDPNCVRAQIGSREAIQAAKAGMTQFAEQLIEETKTEIASDHRILRMCDILEQNSQERAHLIRTLTDSIVADWHKRIMTDLRENPLTEDELSIAKRDADEYRRGINCEHVYGTTLIAALLLGDYLILIQQGDGRCVVFYEDGTVSEPIPWDDRCYSVYTTSMCNADVCNSIRHCVINQRCNPILGCFVGSDGVEDAYGEEDLDARHNFYQTRLCEIDDWDKELFVEKLEEVLSLHSKEGSKDDVSIAGIVFRNAVKQRRKELEQGVKSFEEVYRLQMIVSECGYSLKSMKRKHEYLQDKVVSKQDEISKMEEKLHDYEQMLTSGDMLIKNLEDSIIELKDKLEKAEEGNEEIRRDFREKKYWGFFREKHSQILNIIDQQIARLRSPLQEKQRQIEKQKDHREKQQKEFDKLKECIKLLRSKCSKIEEEYRVYHERYSEIEKQRDEALWQLEQLQNKDILADDEKKITVTEERQDCVPEPEADKSDMYEKKQQDTLASIIELPDYRTTLSVCLRICKDIWEYSRKNIILAGISQKDIRISDRLEKVFWPSEIVYATNRKESKAFRFLPPECNADKQELSPLSNRYTMALLLFEFLTGKHPYEGVAHLQKYSQKQQKTLYGNEMVFIMDAEDASNRPDPYVDPDFYDKWNALPMYVQELFSKAFGRDAMECPDHRPDELEWSKCLTTLKNNILDCTACGQEIVWTTGSTVQCANCGKQQEVPFSLEFTESGYRQAALQHQDIYNIQIADGFPDMIDTIAKIVENERKLGVLGLYNVSSMEWIAYTPSGKKILVAHGSVVPLKVGVVVQIGDKQIEIKKNK